MVGISARLLASILLGAMIALATSGCTERSAASVAPPPIASATTLATATATAAASTPLAAASAPGPAIAWDARTVVTRPDAYYRIPCPAAADPARANPGVVFTVDTPAQLECVVQAMRAAREPETAVTFLQRYGVFLAGFEERGRVDTGSVAAAWQNMGRAEPVFLNAGTSMLPLNLLVGTGPGSLSRQWLSHSAYAAALGGDAEVIAWPEYASLAEEPRGGAGAGDQRFVAELPLRKCRACANLATLRVAFRFDAGGVYSGWELLPPGPSAVQAASTSLPGSTPVAR